MIVADTSALAAVVFGEAERDAFLGLMRRARRVLISTPSVVETPTLLFKGNEFSLTDIIPAWRPET